MENSTMNDSTFEKLTRSDKRLYGPPKLMICGFGGEAQLKFQKVLGICGLSDIPKVWLNSGHSEILLSDLLLLPDQTGSDQDSTLPRAVIVSGINENQLHALMSTCRKAGMKQSLWAVVTPVSETWRLGNLLTELQAERDYFEKKKKG
jgi:hypothetical protein